MKPRGGKKRPQASGRIYGIHPLQEALRGGRPIERIYVAKGRGGSDLDDLIRESRQKKIPVHFETREVLDRIMGHGKHQGVVGFAAASGYSGIDDILSRAAGRGEPPAVVVLDGVEDPRNLGAILRTVEASGIHGVVIPQRRAAGLTETVSKTSAGAVEHIPVARVPNLTQALESLKTRGLWIYGLDLKASRSYLSIDYKGPVALVLGGEDSGIRPRVLEACDERIRLPMKGRIQSLNVSVAAGVVVYEVLRQRQESPPVRP
ncbi:MAG TPA: 23S rRNA (guanosine(2251)-2'-O)-methyltransferase RlmB [Nitrospiria bacterium]